MRVCHHKEHTTARRCTGPIASHHVFTKFQSAKTTVWFINLMNFGCYWFDKLHYYGMTNVHFVLGITNVEIFRIFCMKYGYIRTHFILRLWNREKIFYSICYKLIFIVDVWSAVTVPPDWENLEFFTIECRWDAMAYYTSPKYTVTVSNLLLVDVVK